MIRAFTSLTEDFKSRGINPGFHFMDNEESTALNTKMKTVNIKYQLVPPKNHRTNNTDRSNQIFKNHFLAELCSVDKYFHLQSWDILLSSQQSV